MKKEITELRGTVCQLQAKVDFLLSFVGITESRDVPVNTPSTMSASPVAASTQSVRTDGSNVGSNDVSDELTSGSGDGDRSQMTFADVVRRPPTLNPSLQQAVVSAVYNDFAEHDRRSKNIIINGLVTANGENDKRHVERLLNDEFDMSVDVVKCRRLGRQQTGRVQPLLVVFSSTSDDSYLIENARRLRQSSNPHISESVYTNADLTKAEAYVAYQRRCRRREMTAARRSNTNNIMSNTTGTTGAGVTNNTTVASTSDTSTSAAINNEQQRHQHIPVRVSGVLSKSFQQSCGEASLKVDYDVLLQTLAVKKTNSLIFIIVLYDESTVYDCVFFY